MLFLASRVFPTPVVCFLGSLALACSPASEAVGVPPGAGGSGQPAGGSGAGLAAGGAGGGQTGATGGSTPGTGGAQNGTGSVPSSGGSGSIGTGGSTSGGQQNGTGGDIGSGGDPVFDAGSDPLRNRVQPGVVCERLATVQCAAEAYCCDNPGRTFDQCKQAQLDECAGIFLDEVSTSPASGYSVTAAEAAFTEFESIASQCDPGIAAWSISPEGLRGITLGTVGADQSCAPAVLSAPSAAASLASCTNGASYACLPTGVPPIAPWTCEARGPVNSPCFSDLNCLDGLYCNNDLNAPQLTGSQCLQRKANGIACAYPNECISLTCKGGQCVEPTSQTAYCIAQ